MRNAWGGSAWRPGCWRGLSHQNIAQLHGRPGSPLTVADRTLLVETDKHWTGFGRSFDVAPAGRLLMIRPEPDSMPNQLNVVLNWFEELGRLLPPAR